MNTKQLILTDRESYKRMRRTRKLEALVRRLRVKVEHSDVALRVICDILKEKAQTPEIAPILKAINNRN